MTTRPLAWLLLGPKAGDNEQLLALGEVLEGTRGVHVEARRLAFRSTELATNLLLGVTLAGLDRARSDPLEPPWPELILTAGRRNEPVARWIQRASGARARLVHVGRPWARPDRFDLVVTTPQYQVPPAANVAELTMPLHRSVGVDDDGPWQAPEGAGLPRPWLALFVGGDSGAVAMDAGDGVRIATQATDLAAALDASLLVTTSARTPEATTAALAMTLDLRSGDVPSHLHRFGSAEPNPYRSWLAQADGFIVTTDSMSMLAEAAATGRALWLVEAASKPGAWWRWKPLTHRLAQRFGPRRMRRDTTRMTGVWLAADLAGRLDEERDAARARMAAQRGDVANAELNEVAGRIAKLLGT